MSRLWWCGSVPKRDRQTYLYAKIKLPKGAPYLPGRIELFRDQTFAGFGHLPQLAPGEKHEIGFGADRSRPRPLRRNRAADG